jgi:hypothetical protein
MKRGKTLSLRFARSDNQADPSARTKARRRFTNTSGRKAT